MQGIGQTAKLLSSKSCAPCIWTSIAAAIVASDSTADVCRLACFRPGQRKALQAAAEVVQEEQ
jgi:hypothetical protein